MYPRMHDKSLCLKINNGKQTFTLVLNYTTEYCSFKVHKPKVLEPPASQQQVLLLCEGALNLINEGNILLS